MTKDNFAGAGEEVKRQAFWWLIEGKTAGNETVYATGVRYGDDRWTGDVFDAARYRTQQAASDSMKALCLGVWADSYDWICRTASAVEHGFIYHRNGADVDTPKSEV